MFAASRHCRPASRSRRLPEDPALRQRHRLAVTRASSSSSPSFCWIDACSASIADGSPWTMNVVRGGRVNPPSQRRISCESACADIESIRAIRAWTGTIWPWILTRWRRPRGCGRACLPPDSRRTAPCSGHRAARPEMVQHASAGCHAARRDDDRRHLRSRSAPSILRQTKSSGSARCRTRRADVLFARAGAAGPAVPRAPRARAALCRHAAPAACPRRARAAAPCTAPSASIAIGLSTKTGRTGMRPSSSSRFSQ